MSMFLYMHVLNFMFEHMYYRIGIVAWLGIIILQFLEKELRENLGSILNFPEIPNQSEL